MEKKNGVLKGLLIAAGVITTIVGAMAIVLKIFSKFFKITIEISPEENEDSDCLCSECSKDDIEVEKSDNDDDTDDDEEDDNEIEIEMVETDK